MTPIGLSKKVMLRLPTGSIAAANLQKKQQQMRMRWTLPHAPNHSFDLKYVNVTHFLTGLNLKEKNVNILHSFYK